MSKESAENNSLLRDQVSEIGEYLRFVWASYMRWYTVFLTFNLIALTFLPAAKENYIQLLAGIFILFNALGFTISYFIYNYTVTSCSDIEITRRVIWKIELKNDKNQSYRKTAPQAIATAAALLIMLTMFIFIVAWMIIGISPDLTQNLTNVS